jgi:Tfp pilus assembly protein PilE
MIKRTGAFTITTMMGILHVVAITTLSLPSAHAQPNAEVRSKANQAANLVTEAATITNKWNLDQNNTAGNDSSLRVTDPECKTINPLEYLNNPETFFQSCPANNLNYQNYEPIEYLKVPGLDSSLNVTVTNF